MNDISDSNLRDEPQRLQESLGFLVNSLARLMRVALENKLQNEKFSPTAWTVLMALGENDGLNQTDLSRRTYNDGATITRTLDQLAEINYIERHRDDNDRRVQIVVLTESGRKAYMKAAQYGREINDEATSSLSPTERSRFEESIRKVIDRAQYFLNNEGINGR